MHAPSSPEQEQFVIVCIDDDPADLQALLRDVRELCADVFEVEGCSTAQEALELADALEERKARVPLFLADHIMPGTSGIDLLLLLHDRPYFRPSRKLLLTAQASLDDLTRALNKGALNANLAKPWKPEDLVQVIRLLLTEYFISHAPESLERLSALADVTQISQAFVSVERQRRSIDQQLKAVQRSFIRDRTLDDETVERNMIEEIDRALSSPPRSQLPAGTVILTEGQPVKGIWILLSGKVALTRVVGQQEIIFHSHTVGPVVGLMALANQRESFFTCKAVTDLEAIPVSLPELETALQNNPMLHAHLVTVLLRSLARRNRRGVELQIQINGLNQEIKRERDHLEDTLNQLKQAQTRLVQSEKMATLGQMAAGVAHELNNPIAAINRSADFLMQDISALSDGNPHGASLQAMTQSALARAPISTREQRERRALLAKELGDADLARRLVSIGLTTAEDYRRLFADVTAGMHDTRLAELERHYQIGNALRNITSCAERITGLVGSLKSYARPDTDLSQDVDLHKGIDETLLLFGHELRGITVEKDFGKIPCIACRVGEITQVWTNLISNALRVMSAPAELRIRTDQPDPQHVRVQVIDNGPGIPEEDQKKIFGVNFTTRQGDADFGLGLGLPICLDIVHRHGGQIEVESAPGRTCFSVILPVGRK